MVKENAEEDDGIDECPLTWELSENKLRHNSRLGDITWVKHNGSSWWPAQVIDEACTWGEPKKKEEHVALVRLYGTCQYLCIDPWKSNTEFEMMLKQENKSAIEAFHEVLEKELSQVNSPSDYDEEAVSSKAKTSSKKVRKQEDLKRSGHRGVKESATTEGLGDEIEQYGAEQDQEVGSTAPTGVAVPKGRKREGARESSPTHDKEQAIDKASSENSAEGLRDKTQKHISVVRGKEGHKMATVRTLVVREGLRRSARFNANEYLDAAEDSTSQLSDTSASEDGTEVGNRALENQNQHKDDSMVDGTLAPDAEIRTMVRDILFSDIIARQQADEMAFVDEVIDGICDTTEENMTGSATAATKGGRGIKRSASRVEADSSNVTQRPRKGNVDKVTCSPNEATEDAMQVTWPETMNYRIIKNNTSKGNNSDSLKGIIGTTPSRDAATAELGHSARQIRIMQSLALIAPSGSPFGRNGLVAATHR